METRVSSRQEVISRAVSVLRTDKRQDKENRACFRSVIVLADLLLKGVSQGVELVGAGETEELLAFITAFS